MAEERPLHERPAARPIPKPGVVVPNADVKPDSPTIPSPPEKRPFKWGTGVGCLVVVGILLVGMVSCIAVSSSSHSRPSQDDISSSAQQNCEDLVKRGLKSPSTAKFSDEDVSGSDVMTITGSVDSENSFGASLRASFQCTATVDGDNVNMVVDFITAE